MILRPRIILGYVIPTGVTGVPFDYGYVVPEIPEGSTPVYQSVISATGTYAAPYAHVGIPYNDLVSLKLTIINEQTDLIINSRNQVNVLNVNGGNVDNMGNFTFFLTAEDTLLVDTPLLTRVERSLVSEWVYNGGASEGRHKFRFFVKSLGVP